jgi:hypothetical protein
VTRWLKPELLADPPLDVFKFRNKKLDGIAACGANHVMMRSTVQAELVARYSIVKIDLIGDAALRQELESAINSRITDAGIAFPHEPMQLLGAEMVARGEEHVENTVTLRTLLEALFAQMSSKDA